MKMGWKMGLIPNACITNCFNKMIPGIRVFLSVSLKPAPPYSLLGPFQPYVVASIRCTDRTMSREVHLETGVPGIKMSNAHIAR